MLQRPEMSRSGRLPAVMLGVIVIAATWLLSGVPPRSSALFVGYELVYVLLPGCLLYALLAPSLSGWLRTIAVGWPLGYALEIGAYALTASLHARFAFAFLPLGAAVVLGPLAIRRFEPRRMGSVIVTLGQPAWRDRLLTCRLSRRIDLVVLSVAVSTAVVLLALTYFAAYPLPGLARSVVYYTDNVWDISLAAEARNQWPITEPYLASHALLHYYYGVFIHIAAINQVTGVALSTTILRLLPTTVIAVASLQLWSLGRGMGRSLWIGPMAVVLLLVVQDLDLDPTHPGAFGVELFNTIPLSPTMSLGIVFFLGLLALAQSWLSSEESTELPVRYGGLGSARAAFGWLTMVAILVTGASMVKVTATADFLGGLTLLWIWCAVASGVNRFLSYCLVVSTICAGAVYVLVLRGSTADTLRISLLNFVEFTDFSQISHWHSVARIGPLIGIATLACLFTFVPLLGVCILLWQRDTMSSYTGFSLAVFAVSFAAYLTLGAPGGGEGYFLAFGYIALVPVAAAGLEYIWGAASSYARRGIAITCGGILVLGLLVAASTLALGGDKGIRLYAWYGAAYALVGGAVAIAAVRLEKGFAPAISSRAARLLACCVPMLGALGLVPPIDSAVPRLWKVITHRRISILDSHAEQGMTAALYRGLIWVREHTDSCAVLAVNNHATREKATAETYSRYYYYSAFTERRVFLESWDYAAPNAKRGPAFQAKRSLNELAVSHGNAAALSQLWQQGVRYVLVDRTHGGGAPEPSSVSRLVFANSALDVYRLTGQDGRRGDDGECAQVA
jgi:hypothetical protein